MRIQDLSGKNICMLGYGREGKAMVEALETYAKGCEITIADQNASTTADKKYGLQAGDSWLKNLEKFDVLIKSPGIPPLPEITRLTDKVTTSTQIFLDTVKESGATVIGVTGSKGKSTTSSLIAAILKAAGKTVYLVGNIGIPAISHLGDAKKDVFFVHEMSSYQLMDLTTSPQIAVVTSFFPEHLDYHGSYENYLEAKKHIARYDNDIVFYAEAFAEAKEIAAESQGKKVGFGPKDAPVALADLKLRGEHNLSNVAAAWNVVSHLGIDKKIAVETMKKFNGLPHRLESLGVHGKIEWVNDSISTTPETAVAALRALGKRVNVLIVGGKDRGYDFSPLADEIKKSPHLRMVILLPESGTVIGKAIEHAGAPVILSTADTLEEAVTTARKAALDPAPEETPIVLLSPAAPSYGHFKNFEERGELFRGLVKA